MDEFVELRILVHGTPPGGEVVENFVIFERPGRKPCRSLPGCRSRWWDRFPEGEDLDQLLLAIFDDVFGDIQAGRDVDFPRSNMVTMASVLSRKRPRERVKAWKELSRRFRRRVRMMRASCAEIWSAFWYFSVSRGRGGRLPGSGCK